MLTCSISLPSIIKIFLIVTELSSGNENEVKYAYNAPKQIVDDRPPARPAADIHHFNSQIFLRKTWLKIILSFNSKRRVYIEHGRYEKDKTKRSCNDNIIIMFELNTGTI